MNTVITFIDLKADFEQILEKSIDKKYTIDIEMNEVLSFVNDTERKSIKKSIQYSNPNKFYYKLYVSESDRFFKKSFNDYIESGTNAVERRYNDTDDTYLAKQNILKQANEFAEYYKWLRTLSVDNIKATKNKSILTHKQKLLTLHYLGFDFSNFDNTKIAKVLSEVLELNEDNTRQYLSYLTAGKNDVRTKNNLEAVRKVFENQGLTDISSAIQKDIDKL